MLVTLSLQAALSASFGSRLRERSFGFIIVTRATYVPSGGYVAGHGGWSIFPFQVLRLIANGALCGLCAFSAATIDSRSGHLLALSSVSGRRHVRGCLSI
jgi:hypothetical protein